MRILVVGNGAREHALVWKLAQSPKVNEIYAAPGNAGTAQIGQNLDIKPGDIESLAKIAQKKGVELTVVGPETPLAQGIVDHFQGADIPIFGPTKGAAEIESSKVFSKELMQKYNIPCASSVSFPSYTQAKKYIQKQIPPIVVKADGLAAGKGVIIADSIPKALVALAEIMGGSTFGAAGDMVVIEEFLSGNELSSFAFTDGSTVIPIAAACDYKPVFDSNLGPNTGGMGSYTPPYFYNSTLAKTIKEAIMEPAVKAMQKEGRPYKGVLYGGLILTNNELKVLEFNARFGDPETQVILPLLKTDLVEIMLAVTNDRLNQINVEWNSDACVGVVMASGGYPNSYKTGFPITGLGDVGEDIMIFHAGTRLASKAKQILTSGGRVLTVATTGKTVAEAREKVYDNISRIHFEGCHYRKDIALIKEG